METNVFELSTVQLKEIALDLKDKVEKGLQSDNTEILCLSTYVYPPKEGVEGKSVVLDLGGTNYRTAKVEIQGGETIITPKSGWEKDLSVMKTPGYTKEQLFAEQANLINKIELPDDSAIGYCFSYPAKCETDGDATLLRWTKGVNIDKMVGKPIGKDLLDYLNDRNKVQFKSIKVINDTVASLLAGLSRKDKCDAYIGLIVGTGTNMAFLARENKIAKLNKPDSQNMIPVNLESGNFFPSYLTEYDSVVDRGEGEVPGSQRFEKAVSGMYLGKVFRAVYPNDDYDASFDGKSLTDLINSSTPKRKGHVSVARWIYERSAKLVAASLAGLIAVQVMHDPSIKTIRVVAEGSLFWSVMERVNENDFHTIVAKVLRDLLDEMDLGYVEVYIAGIKNANLIGSAIAALS